VRSIKAYNIHGDNIVECIRTLDYIRGALGNLVLDITGPTESVTCPVYKIKLANADLRFQFLPGYGEQRWNQDILGFIKRSGGRLREAADAIITLIQNGNEHPLAAIEFCGALPAGNQAWQRQGRAFSFAHAKIPYFYVAELGGFELSEGRERKAERMPNPAVPFSFYTITHYQGSVCLPVYEANPGARIETIEQYESIFGKASFLEFLKFILLGENANQSAEKLSKKCITLVNLLADKRSSKDGLSSKQWCEAEQAILNGETLPNYLYKNAQIKWSKKAYINSLTLSARIFMALGASDSLGLTSSSLPISFVPTTQRAEFAQRTQRIYLDLADDFLKWLASDVKHLAIAWVMGFKPRGDDARPDRGLPPLAKMLVGDDTELLSFIYGPAPVSHWEILARNPIKLASSNGLWESILAVSDGLIIDSSTKPPNLPRGYLKSAWSSILKEENMLLCVEPVVVSLGEQDVDTALHIAFEFLGVDVVFEGMCNPPGGDWSGISFRWDKLDVEHRWLTLPRVSSDGAKRPDHVFSVFGEQPICLCIESKEKARSLEQNIGPRLVNYAQALFETAPSISRLQKIDPWMIYKDKWSKYPMQFISAGAYLSDPNNPFRGLPDNTNLDIQIGVSFSNGGKKCTFYLRGDTHSGQSLVEYLASLNQWGEFVDIVVSN